MGYECTQALRERNPKIIAKVPLTSRRPYVIYPIGFRGSGVLGRIAFAGVPLVTDPRSSRKKHRQILDSSCQQACFIGARGAAYAGVWPYRACPSTYAFYGQSRFVYIASATEAGQVSFPANNRAEVLPAMGWSTKAVRLRVGARSNGCPGETNALTFGEFSRQRSGSRSRGGEFALLRLRPGPISNQPKALGISGNTAAQGADTRIRRGKPCL